MSIKSCITLFNKYRFINILTRETKGILILESLKHLIDQTILPKLWPEDALLAVATRFLKEVDLSDEMREKCVSLCLAFHTSTTELSEAFFNDMGRLVQ